MRHKSNGHLNFIRSCPCVICKDDTTTEAAHVRFGYSPIAKPITGMGIKPDDCYVVPLCGRHHREQHQGDEKQFWIRYGVMPSEVIQMALALHAHTGDYQRGLEIVSASAALRT